MATGRKPGRKPSRISPSTCSTPTICGALWLETAITDEGTADLEKRALDRIEKFVSEKLR